MTLTVADAIAKFPKLLRLVRGDAATPIAQPCAASRPQAGRMLFLNERRLIARAVRSPATVLVVNDADVREPALDGARQTVLQSPNAELAMTLVCRTFFPATTAKQNFDGHRIHPSAVISASARIAHLPRIRRNVDQIMRKLNTQ